MKVDGLNALRTKDLIYINPKDAADVELNEGEIARVMSRWGEISGKLRLTNSTPAGLMVMNLEEDKINQIVNPALDGISKTPEMNICAVRVEREERVKK